MNTRESMAGAGNAMPTSLQPSEATFEDKFKERQQEYSKRLAAHAAQMEANWTAAIRGGFEAESLEAFVQLSHRLAGSAGTFGIHRASEIAGALENRFGVILSEGRTATPAEGHEIADMLVELKKAAALPPAAMDGVSSTPARSAARRVILTTEEGIDQTHRKQIEELGFDIRVIASIEEMLAQAGCSHPYGILIDVSSANGPPFEIERLAALREAGWTDLSVILLSDRDDFETRLMAVRVGADAFLPKPIEPFAAIKRLDAIAAERERLAYRVLVVEGGQSPTSDVASALDGNGFLTFVSGSPANAFGALNDFHPEIIVVDVVLRGCTGLEFAKTIWHEGSFGPVPVVFLSPNAKITDQLLAMGLGTGEILTRPINQRDLTETVVTRVRQSRMLQGLSINASPLMATNDTSQFNVSDQLLADWQTPIVDDTTPPTTAISRPTVLVVEDDYHLSELIKDWLQTHGYDVFQAFNGRQGYELAHQERPNAIISDYSMPAGDGGYLLSRLKSTGETKDIPVIILTGAKVSGRKNYALEREMLGRARATAYLEKPVELPALLNTLKRNIRISG